MAISVQIKRGVLVNRPSLLAGEFYYATDTSQLFVGPVPTLVGPTSGGGLTFIIIEKDLGALAKKSGVFDITGLSGLITDKQVLIEQAVAIYTGKGTLKDEASMNLASASGYVLNSTTIRVYWSCGFGQNLKGNIKWSYAVSA